MSWKLRALLLFMAGVLSPALSVGIGLAYHRLVNGLTIRAHEFWAQMGVLEVLPAATVAMIISMMLPPAIAGSAMMSCEDLDDFIRSGPWGLDDNDGSEIVVVWGLSCFCLAPVLALAFPQDHRAMEQVFMADSVYWGAFTLTLISHAVINSVHMRKRKKEWDEDWA